MIVKIMNRMSEKKGERKWNEMNRENEAYGKEYCIK